jgi:hypothetical protein
MARKKSDFDPIEAANDVRVGRVSKGGFERDGLDPFETLHLVEPRSAEHSNHLFGHVDLLGLIETDVN